VDNTGFATRHGRLRLDGVQLVDASGEPVQLMGMSSHGLHWFGNCYTKASIQYLVEHWGINVFRAAMYVGENGYASDASVEDLLHDIVGWTEDLGIYVIIDWHVLTPGDPNDQGTYGGAADFFSRAAARYADKEHVIYETANEPNGVSWSSVKSYHDSIIPVIREHDSEAIIIAGTPTWSQDIHQAAADRVSQPYHVMYGFHFYAGTHSSLRARVREYATVLPIFVSEWGTSQASGNAGVYLTESKAWLDLLADIDDSSGIKISWAQWSYADKAESSAALQPGACASQNWQATSCSGSFLSAYIKTNVEL
jgi:endoglucanase